MQRGFSIVELLVVFAIISVLSALSVLYLAGHQRLFRPDVQAMSIVDVLQEARQRSLTQRETMRVEIDLTDRSVRLIDENGASTVEDDLLIRESKLHSDADVKMGVQPVDIATVPEESLPVPIADFRPSVYPPSVTNTVCTLRFQRNGTVVNQGSDAIGSNATNTGATIYVWSLKPNLETESDIARAVTVIGGSGAIRVWEYDRSVAAANKWVDSRRSASYGGQTGN